MKKNSKTSPGTKKVIAKTPLKKKVSLQNNALVTKGKNTWKKNSWLRILAIGNVVGLIAVLIVNYLAVTLPLGGMTTWALSDLYPNLFVPAWLTFSIWGLIYLLLVAFVIWQLVDFYKNQSRGITKKLGLWFIFSCITNVWRMFAWQYQQVWVSVIVMILFLLILIVISRKIEIGKKIGSLWDKYLVQVPFSIYLGRISVATIANITALLVHIGWNMWGIWDIFRTIAVIVVATILALLSIYKNYNIIFALVIIWAFIGIIIKRVNVDPVYATSIIRTLGVCIAVITAGIGSRFDQWRKN